MKNFIISLTALLLVFATSCNEMDQYPHNAVSSDNLTEEDARLLLTGLYFYMQNKPTANGYLTQDVVGGELVRGGATGLKDPILLVKDLVTPESGFVSGPWDGFYTALYQVNSLIVSLNKLPDTSSRNEILGVASFFRGLLYYNLVAMVKFLSSKLPFQGILPHRQKRKDGVLWKRISRRLSTTHLCLQIRIMSPSRRQRL